MKVDEQLKCKDCDWYGSCKYYHNRKETSQICKMFNNTWVFVEKLEKIKVEMESRVKLNNDLENYDIATGLSISLGILDKHISELKGETE